ncbi:plastin-1-like isoform X2 [Tachypleus tridentatus]|uniref:plastin-1-like isoform X2 n=1 Tax=Tachypleus tridentatus TaxID=6853 RepID=UPI003FCFCB93
MAEPRLTSTIFTEEQFKELYDNFLALNRDGSGYLDISELKQALETVGLKFPQWKVRQMIYQLDKSKFMESRGQLSFEEFQKLCIDLKSNDVTSKFKKAVSKRENLQTIGGMSQASSEGTTHSVRYEEQVAFSDWINSKIINHSCPETIDERAINKKYLSVYTKHENLTLALNSAKSIGCKIVNIDASDLSKGKPHLILGLLWQIIRIGLFNQITLEQCPGLVHLLFPEENMANLCQLSPENILIRWVNYHLERAGVNRRLTNFTSDVTDSEIYTHLLNEISPPPAGVTTEALNIPNLVKRAEVMLQQADKIGCCCFVSPNDVVDGIYKLNVAFVANLFNNYPALNKPEFPLELDNLEETREEKTYRHWINSMGVNPHVNWLCSDLADGLIIFQLFDIIKPGMVNWNKVHKLFNKLKFFMEKVENCNYAVELGKQLKFSLVGIAGNDISKGNPTLTLALVWQLMRAYTLGILTRLAGTGNPLTETQIVDWVNKKLKESGKPTSIKGFQDSAISHARPVIDLVDAIQPGSINYSTVFPGSNTEECMANAKYAISVARKIGACIYALPEDIVEVKSKMVMTVFACLMSRAYIPNMGTETKNMN